MTRAKEGTREKQPSCFCSDGYEWCRNVRSTISGAGLQAGCKVKGQGGSGAPEVGREDSSRTVSGGRREEEDGERMAAEEKSEARMRNGVRTSRPGQRTKKQKCKRKCREIPGRVGVARAGLSCRFPRTGLGKGRIMLPSRILGNRPLGSLSPEGGARATSSGRA